MAENESPALVLRSHRDDDMEWVIRRHGKLYWKEYQWDERFEELVAEIVATFINNYKPEVEHCWIAELSGQRVGSVFLVQHAERTGVAQLRLLLVEPDARGAGVGRRLVQECTTFARAAGYERIMLWTNSVLHAARAIYESEGYVLVGEEPHDSFGTALVSQTWELDLAGE